MEKENKLTLITTQQAAEYLGTTSCALYQAVHHGRNIIPYYKMGPKRIRYALEDVQEFLQKNKIPVCHKINRKNV